MTIHTANVGKVAMRRSRRERRGDGGSVLVASIAIAFILVGLAASTLRTVYSVQNETQQERDDLVRRYLAESAAGFRVQELGEQIESAQGRCRKSLNKQKLATLLFTRESKMVLPEETIDQFDDLLPAMILPSS